MIGPAAFVPALAAKALDRDTGGEVGREHLDHHVAGERDVAREEDARHPAAAELALDDRMHLRHRHGRRLLATQQVLVGLFAGAFLLRRPALQRVPRP